MALLEIKDVHAYYGNIHALKGVSLTVEEGEIVSLIVDATQVRNGDPGRRGSKHLQGP